MKRFFAVLSALVLLAAPAYAIERDPEKDALFESMFAMSVDDMLAMFAERTLDEQKYGLTNVAAMHDALYYVMCLVYDINNEPLPSPSLDGLTYDQLIAHRDALNLAIWNSEEWQEVTVPQGLYKIGEDIPAGHWTFAIADIGGVPYLQYGNKLEGNKKEVSFRGDIYYAEQLRGPDSGKYYDPKHDLLTLDLILEEGCWLEVSNSPVKVTPYAGKPDLGFK